MAIADFAGGMNAVKQQLWQRQMAEMQARQDADALAQRSRQFDEGMRFDRERFDFDREQANRPGPEPQPVVVGGRLVTRTGQVLYEPPAEPAAPEKPVAVGGRLVMPSSGKVVFEPPAEAKADTQEPLVPVIGDDGRPVLMPRSQAAGRQPASTREQTGNRPITSGDAGRIADFDTSMDDLDVLDSEIGQTGAASKLGAIMPNIVTEFTGFGEDAKARQGMINRVKQVIGKALEGGVLRKEDEIKYEKILPTIGDDPQVAQSKLKGLRTALEQRRQTFLDSLGDAGYDTAKYSARQRAPKKTETTKPSAADLIKKYGGGGGR